MTNSATLEGSPTATNDATAKRNATRRNRAKATWLVLALAIGCGGASSDQDARVETQDETYTLGGEDPWLDEPPPEEAGLDDAAPGDAAPGDAAPGDAAPGDAAPEATTDATGANDGPPAHTSE